MTEHVIVIIVIVKLLSRAFTIESRGKLGLISYVTKLALRVANKFAFVRNKKIEYLEQESTKIAEESFQKKEIRLVYDKLP